MTYGECNKKVREILSQVNDEHELALVEKLGAMEYGVLEKTLSSEIMMWVASEFGLEPDK